jgi:hypothetical protein
MLILLMTKALRDRVLRKRSESASADPSRQARRSAHRARAEADEVRAMAAGYVRHDPSFAKELYAAADRHEQLAMEHQPAQSAA